jgi:predicted Fe-Mo cluster-binding NifX family protein
MTRLAFPLSHDRLDAPLSEHFGKCKWLGLAEAGAAPRFLRNEGLNGRWVAEALAAAGVTDVVAGHMGGGALAHLQTAGLRAWQASPAGATAAALAEAFAAGQLAPMTAPPPHEHGPDGPDGHGGCGCQH